MINSLQILRGLAAWVVVVHHIVQSYFMGDTKNSTILVVAQKYGSLGVDIFFVLSGVVMALVADKYARSGMTFGINRVFRLVPAYWFYTLLLVVSILLFPSGTYLTWWEGESLLKSILLIPNKNPNGYGYYPTLYVGWTLIYEMFFYLLFSSILLLRVLPPKTSCAFILFLVAVLARNNNFLGHSSWLLIEFAIGIVIAIILILNPIKNSKILPLIFVLSLLLLSVFFKFQGWSLFSKMLGVGSFVCVFILLEKYLSFESRIINFFKSLGDWSYSTYLSHVIVIGWYFHFFADKKSAAYDLIAFFGIIITVYFISFLSFRFVESNTCIASLKIKLITMLTKSSSGR